MAEAIKAKTAKIEGAIGLRLSVKKGGCSGNEYKMEPAREKAADEEVFEKNGAFLHIPFSSSLYLFGMTIDHETGAMKSGFVFNNPKVTASCGCGESVSFTPPPGMK